MGGGIAMALANAGMDVRIKDTTQEALDRGLATVRKNYQNSVNKGRFPQSVMDQRMALIHPQLDYAGFEEADIIIEAAFESMEVKKQLFAEIDKVAKPDCVLATNTSTLDIDEIASATSRPEMVIGHALLQPRERHAPGRNRARQGHQRPRNRHRDGARKKAAQSRSACRQLPWASSATG